MGSSAITCIGLLLQYIHCALYIPVVVIYDPSYDTHSHQHLYDYTRSQYLHFSSDVFSACNMANGCLHIHATLLLSLQYMMHRVLYFLKADQLLLITLTPAVQLILCSTTKPLMI